MKRLDLLDISAYLDGALPPHEHAQVEAALAVDPAAKAMLNRFKHQVDELHRLYDPVLAEPIPDEMLRLLNPARTDGAETGDPQSSGEERWSVCVPRPAE